MQVIGVVTTRQVASQPIGLVTMAVASEDAAVGLITGRGRVCGLTVAGIRHSSCCMEVRSKTVKGTFFGGVATKRGLQVCLLHCDSGNGVAAKNRRITTGSLAIKGRHSRTIIRKHTICRRPNRPVATVGRGGGLVSVSHSKRNGGLVTTLALMRVGLGGSTGHLLNYVSL